MHQQYVDAMRNSGVETGRIGRVVRIVMVERFRSSLIEKIRNIVAKEKDARHQFYGVNGLPDPTPFLLDEEAAPLMKAIDRIIND